jgi:hypothetical protein
MILVDTSAWVDHFRTGNDALKALLLKGEVIVHPFTVGELACGSMKKRPEILRLLAELPEVIVPYHAEVLQLVESRRLFGTGIGWIDAHLPASAVLSQTKLLTLDMALAKAVSSLGIGVTS